MSWYQFRDESSSTQKPDLYNLLEVASNAFIAHTDWSIRHRDTSLRQLAVLIAAELIVLKFHRDIPTDLNIGPFILLSFGFLAFVLSLGGAQSVGRAYLASMENVLFMNKLMWAINPSGKVNLPEKFLNAPYFPASDDETLFVYRYQEESTDDKTTKAFTEKRAGKNVFSLGHPSNTLFWAKLSIYSMGFIGLSIGLAGGMVLFKN